MDKTEAVNIAFLAAVIIILVAAFVYVNVAGGEEEEEEEEEGETTESETDDIAVDVEASLLVSASDAVPAAIVGNVAC